jgi:flagellar hook-length control protein FliK
LPVQTKSSESQVQPVKTDTDKSEQTAEKQTDDNTDGLKTFSQTSNESVKETLDIRNNTSGDSAARKLNVTDVQISADEPKDTGNSSTDGNTNTTSEQMLNFNTLQNTAAEQSLNTTSGTKSAELTSQNHQSEPSTDVGKQILESIHSSMTRQGADQQITVRLNPPELGNVVIKFQEQDNQVTGLLEVSKSQTRFEIEQALPQIAKSLSDAGIQVRRLEVVLSSQDDLGREASREHLMQNGNSQNQNANDSDSWQNGPDRGEINEFLLNDIYQYKSGLQDAFATSGSINMLM